MHSRMMTTTTRLALSAMLSMTLAASWVSTVHGTQPTGQNTGDASGPSEAKSTLVQDPAWVDLKNSGRVQRPIPFGPVEIASSVSPLTFPSSIELSPTVTAKIVEPQGNLYDDLHHSLSDLNYWNFCSAGGAAVALYWWTSNVTSWPAGNFSEPYGTHVSTTYWKSSDTGTSSDTSNLYSTNGRAYLMYLAEKVKPPSYSRAGIVNFDYYPTHGGSLADIRDALNWEASGHSSGWSNYFYVLRGTSGLTQATFLSDVRQDIANSSAPVVVDVNTYLSSTTHLPNWSRNLAHTISIIGYNDTNSTLDYTDTCGKACNGSASAGNGGVYVVSYATMYSLLTSLGYGYDW